MCPAFTHLELRGQFEVGCTAFRLSLQRETQVFGLGIDMSILVCFYASKHANLLYPLHSSLPLVHLFLGLLVSSLAIKTFSSTLR